MSNARKQYDNATFEPQTYALERLVDAEGKEYWEYLKFSQGTNGDYAVAILNAITGTTHSATFHNNYGAGSYQFKREIIKRNGGSDMYKTQFGETRENKQQALAIYFDRLCVNSRSIADFERYYLGTYPDLIQFAFNSLVSAFTASDLPSLKVSIKDLDLKAIADRWFDPVTGSLTVAKIERVYGSIYHVYQIPQNPGVDAGNSTKPELNNVFDLLGM